MYIDYYYPDFGYSVISFSRILWITIILSVICIVYFILLNRETILQKKFTILQIMQ